MAVFTSTLTLFVSFTAMALAATNFNGTNLAVGTTVGNWKYLGCANEIPGRALTGLSFSAGTMTIEACQNYCSANQFPYAGVEYSEQCFCGNELTQPATLGMTICTMPCTGNKNEMCGGNGALSVFQNTKYVAPAPPKTVGSWTYQNCYMEPQGARALPFLVLADDGMTTEMCTAACAAAKYPYAGLEYGRECWCGPTLSNTLKSASDPGCMMTCDMLCGGNPSEICGGSDSISIYHNSGISKRSGMDDVNIDTLRARRGRFLKVVRPEVPTNETAEEEE
ncbi:WSC-domain-containing protein [Xylariaceae sp. FL0255]|nr:WSC-domain-containing protein [Xylariaceae sp. FL0255]